MRIPNRKKLINICDRYTEVIHAFFGFASALIAYQLFPEASFLRILYVSLLGAVILPDVDHILLLFWYGRNNNYSKEVKKAFKKAGFKGLYSFCMQNHKLNTGSYFHNIFSLGIVVALFIWAAALREYALSSALLLSWVSHYLWDMAEDYIYFGKLNPNWFLGFNRSSNKRVDSKDDKISKF